ncbi:uncharacterized protein tmem200ca [Polymixia lowei]
MIATGGLLRINARRQDSVSKPQNHNTHKRKRKKKRRSEVVVVKGKLRLCSVSGLVAALGILVLLVGVVMAVLGYWPQEGLFFSTQPQGGSTLTTAFTTTAAAQGGKRGTESDFTNSTDNVNGTNWQSSPGFLEEFLNRYLYSDRLKVIGPLVMGVGIFLFICANAVLHENRDKKTKVINLRDIYSTVIDLHSLRKPPTDRCPSANPLNGLVNYVQSKSLEGKPKAVYSTALLAKWGGGGGGGGGGEEGVATGRLSRQLSLGSSRRGGGTVEGDTVFSIYQENTDPPLPLPLPSPNSDPNPSHNPRLNPRPRLSLPSSCVPSSQVGSRGGGAFTLPLARPRATPGQPHPPTQQRRHSARAAGLDWPGSGRALERGSDEVFDSRNKGDKREEERKEGDYACFEYPLSNSQMVCPNLPRFFRQISMEASRSSLPTEAVRGSQALLLLSSSSLTPSHLSLSSLSHLLSSSSSTPPLRTPVERSRRLSCPSSTVGYTKLAQAGGESFESSEVVAMAKEGGQGRCEFTTTIFQPGEVEDITD